MKKATRGSEFLNPENLNSMNINGIFTAKKATRGSEFLNPENLKSMNINGYLRRRKLQGVQNF